MRTAPGTNLIVKSSSLFGGSPEISSGNTSEYPLRTGISSSFSFSSLLLCYASVKVTAKDLHPFRIASFSCKVEICLIVVFLGIPVTFTVSPSLFKHVKVLSKQFKTTLCCSN